MRPNSAITELRGRELEGAAQAAGCRVLARTTLHDGERTWPVLELECGSNEGAIQFLNRAAALDSAHPEVRDLALRLRAAAPSDAAFVRMVQAWIKVAVRFVREARETFQHALFTITHRAGDCDDHARAVAALVMAGGGKARVVGVPNAQGSIAHVAPIVVDADKRWRWAETTVDARFGEHPREATKRLGLGRERPDVWSERREAKQATK